VSKPFRTGVSRILEARLNRSAQRLENQMSGSFTANLEIGRTISFQIRSVLGHVFDDVADRLLDFVELLAS
jgi:hypothetical protein